MSTRLISGFVMVLAIVASGFAQQTPHVLPGPASDAASVHQKLLDAVAASEAMTRKAEQEHLPDLHMARIYWNLAMSYEDAGETGRAEAALVHAETLFRRSDTNGGELAEALDGLAILNGATGKISAAEKEELEALQLRQKLGNRLTMARSWATMSALMLKQKKFDQAGAFAQQAADEFAENAGATFRDKLSARYALGMALCGQKDYATAVPVLKSAVADARSELSVQSAPVGIGEFLLGYAYWKAGDTANAGVEMKTGIDVLNSQFGWGAPSYLPVLRMYAKYLHETRNVAEANEVNQRIQQAESVVSVGQLQSNPAVFGFAGLH